MYIIAHAPSSLHPKTTFEAPAAQAGVSLYPIGPPSISFKSEGTRTSRRWPYFTYSSLPALMAT